MSRRSESDGPYGLTSGVPHHDMVHWFDPGQLLSTGVEVFTATTLGQRGDYRLTESHPQAVYDYSASRSDMRDGMWFDYMADTGDGWDSTYAMASLVAQPYLTIGDKKLPRGRFLLFGGDEVYPAAQRTAYRERLVTPLERALPETHSPHPALFAIPGNHDWYDGLAAFSRLFLQQRWIGGWQTRQTRSYFAIKLPQRWWLLAVDIQLESDIDPPQLAYFRWAATGMRPGDHVILATAEPDWLYRDIYDPVAESNLGYLEEKVIIPTGAKVHLWLAGDLHHYRRHEHATDPSQQRIVSGGGGAYLAPTHKPFFGPEATSMRHSVTVGDQRFEQRRAFPTPATSLRLSLLNLFFLVTNWRFGLLTGLAYAGLTWASVPSQPPDLTPSGVARAFLALLNDQPGRVPVLLAVLAGFVFFTYYSGRGDQDGRLFRLIGGFLHGGVHIAAAHTIAYGAAVVCGDGFLAPLWRLLVNFVGGATVGPVLWGLYLMFAYSIFGAHGDESFSALRIKDYKNFLRLHIQPSGDLEIFPIGVTKVPRRASHGHYMLIEEKVVIPRHLL